MSVKAQLRYTRISPRKVRLVADLIRGSSVSDAEKILEFTIKRASNPILKLLKSAVANAENNFNLKKENLYIEEIRVDGGPIIKRFRPRARGAAYPIQKKTSHILIVLKEGEERKESKKELKSKKQKAEKINKTYSEERPKDDKTNQPKAKRNIEREKSKESGKESKGEKKQIFRRKSI